MKAIPRYALLALVAILVVPGGHAEARQQPRQRSASVPDRKVIVVQPTAGAGTVINAAITTASAAYVADGTPRTVQLLTGVYDLDGVSIAVANGVNLEGVGAATIVDATDITGSDDDPTNAVIKIEGALATSVLDTTLAANAFENATSITVTAIGGGTIGTSGGEWLQISGHNTSNAYDDSDEPLIVRTEIVKVASRSGTTITLTTPLKQSHLGAGTITVKGWTPVVNARVANLDIKGENGDAAVGIHVRGAVDISIERISGAGMSRRLVELNQGTIGARINGLHSRGENNGLIGFDSAHSNTVYDVTSDPAGISVARYDTRGVVRGMINFYQCSTGNTVMGGHIQYAGQGVRLWGGKTNSVTDIVFEDLDITRVQTTGQLTGGSDELNDAGRIGVCVDMGAPLVGAGGNAEFAHGTILDGIICRSPLVGYEGSDFKTQAAYIHDHSNISIGSLVVENKGAVSATVGGIALSDVTGSVASFEVVGYYYCLRTENVYADVQIASLRCDGRPGTGSLASIPLYFDHSTFGPKIEQVRILNTNGSIARFGGAMADYYHTWIGRLITDIPSINTNVVVATSGATSFASFEVADLDQTTTNTTRAIVAPSAAIPGQVVVVTGASADIGTGFHLVAMGPGPNTTSCTAAEVQVGDTVQWASGRSLAAAAASVNTIGVAQTYKSAAGAGNVTVNWR